MATSSISNVGSISSAGLGSGLDVNSIVTQLMAVESRPLTLLQTQASSLQSKLSTFGSLQSQFSTLRDKSNALLAPSLWSATTATSDDAAAVKVATTSNAQPGAYAISVGALASTQTLTATALASSGATLNAGSLTIELGTWSTGPGPTFTPGFAAKSGAAAVSVAIGSSDTSLASIRDKINAAGAGVTATIITDASGARLSLRSQATGAENGFRVSATETSDDGVAGTGLSMLAYDPSNPVAGTSNMGLSQAAANASASINGIAVSSASNILTNVVDGLTVSLLKTTTGAVNVSVATDTAAIQKSVTDFVAAFNSLAGFIHTQTAYNAGSKSGGLLQGDASTIALQNRLRGVLNQASSASATWSTLSDIGIAMQSDGSLATDATKLGNAVGNLGELKKLLYTNGADSASSGFVRRFQKLATTALSADGVFDSRTAGLNASLLLNSKSQDAMQTRLDGTQARLRAQYSALDTKMAQLNGLSSYLTQQITSTNRSTA